jgi:hypothetical protein
MRTKVLAAAALLLALTQPACGSRVYLEAPQATLANTLLVRTFDAYAKGDRVWVKMVVTNVSPQPIVLDRDGFALKLPSGEILPRASGTTTQHTPYPLAPGQGRDVFVDFHAGHEMESIPGAMLVVGGIMIGGDPTPRVVGEIPLRPEPR